MLINSCLGFSLRRLLALTAFVVCLVLAWRPVAASDLDDARAYYNKGLSAYALGEYATAADLYEKAFALSPDSALLYNAAQAQRLAGNKPRALMLYQNYLRVFGATVKNRAEVERHIAGLKRAIEADAKVANSPSFAPAPMGSGAPAGKKPGEAATTAPVTSQLSPEQVPTSQLFPEQALAPRTEHSEPARVETVGSDHAPASSLGSSGAAATTKIALEEQVSASTDLTSAPETRRPSAKKTWIWGVVAAVVVVVGVGVGLGVGLGVQPGDPASTFGVARVQ